MKEKSKKKCGEHLIGKIIYATLLFAPLFSILATTLYTVINKNAYQSYYGETINQEEIKVLNNVNDIINNRVYYRNAIATESGTLNAYTLYYTNIKIIRNIDTGLTDEEILSSVKLVSSTYNVNSITALYDENNTVIGQIPSSTGQLVLSLFINNVTTPDFSRNENIYTITYNKYSFLDNSFEYGIYKVEQNNLYNWAKSTGTYTVIKATAQGLGITNEFTPMLLTYWLVISIMYFIYDIGLVLVVIVHRKIHDLEDSML